MKREFGRINGTPVEAVRLECGEMSAEILTYGATLRSLNVPDVNGAPVDVVLGYDSLEDYTSRSGRLGATIGRFANRISGASFPLGGKVYDVTMNRGKHHIHGGNHGFDKRVWEIASLKDDSVTLHLTSPDGDEGYPGKLDAELTYILTEKSLRLKYLAQSDSDTVCSLTNHSYFNLGGTGTVEDHTVALPLERYTEADSEGIPTGRILPTEGFYDLSSPVVIGDRLKEGSYDVNYLLDAKGTCALAYCPRTGIHMKVDTDMPALQFYTAGGLKDGTPGKNSAVYGRFSGMCFETQFCPDSPNRPEFPSCVLREGEEYRHTTVFSFEAKH
ncbi:Aldose 1-epimerase [methanogenic archaeon ISO4-H5]|nr:Aldose 1-epimerase [methanogenic archaeon ISO4-H5]